MDDRIIVRIPAQCCSWYSVNNEKSQPLIRLLKMKRKAFKRMQWTLENDDAVTHLQLKPLRRIKLIFRMFKGTSNRISIHFGSLWPRERKIWNEISFNIFTEIQSYDIVSAIGSHIFFMLTETISEGVLLPRLQKIRWSWSSTKFIAQFDESVESNYRLLYKLSFIIPITKKGPKPTLKTIKLWLYSQRYRSYSNVHETVQTKYSPS